MIEFGSKVDPLVNIEDHPVVRGMFGSSKPEVINVKQGNIIYERGNDATPLLVVEGRLARQTSSPYLDSVLTHSLAGPGDVILEGLTGQASPVRVFAERDSSFIPLPPDEMQDLIHQNNEGSRLIVAQLLNRGNQGADLAHMTRFGFRAPFNKAAYALVTYGPFAKRIQTPEREVWDISSAATQSELAQAAGMDRHSLNTVALKQLQRKRVIERPIINHNTGIRTIRGIQIVDVALLEKFADPSRT